ncbi:MAG: hypothetical protein IAF00_10470 [Phycisphaerales bacterium]|nr:hypothetical protein [Phycisphaerales bacterium]
MEMITQYRGRLGFWVVLLLMTACSGPADSPETEIRQFIARAQTAAEERNIGDLRTVIADNYSDSEGRDHKAVEQLMRLYILRNQSVHLFVRIRDIVLTGPDHAMASIAVAMAARPMNSADQLIDLNADLYRFDLELTRQAKNDWRVLRASWERAKLDDFW